ICIFTAAEGLLNRIEVFDETDLDKALARFEELHPSERKLQNAVTRVGERDTSAFASRDWVGFADLVADDFFIEDRRSTVNAGIRRGREAEIEDHRAAAEVGFTDVTWTAVATRG